MPGIDQKLRRIGREPVFAITLLCVLLWSALAAYSWYWNRDNLHQQVLRLARDAALTTWNKDQAFRQWATRHGGVYVKPDARTPPNPHLAHLPDRDLTTTDGKKLTLMNPAYMMRQMTEEFEQSYGVKGKITGMLQLNPRNAPDEWERQTLKRFESDGVSEVVEQVQLDGKPYLRLMRPMYMTPGCVKCHGVLGYRDGDLRGGVSVSVPLSPYWESARVTERSIDVTHALVWFIGGAGFLAFGLFVSSRKRERQALLRKLEHDALYDSLTGLPNRYLFKDRLTQELERCRREHSRRFAVCFLDLDRFKNLNDSFGHSSGDQLLVEVAGRIEAAIRPGDSVARMGGDEFTVLLTDVGDEKHALSVSQRLLDVLKPPVTIDKREISVSASIGLCLAGVHYDDADAILRDADIAMYRAKARGKGRIDAFDPSMHREIENLTAMEAGLRRAIVNNELSLAFQPIVHVEEGRTHGFEALLRWTHPELGRIPPDKFIPLAEDSGLINSIGLWVLERACSEIARWNREVTAHSPLFIAVNLSAQQVVHSRFHHSVTKVLERTQCLPQWLHVEVTETQLIEEQEAAAKTLIKLRKMGIGIAADDFGKGYSSLTYLQNFPFSVLKVDKEFVQDMGNEGRGQLLTKSLIGLAADLNIGVIAEGVETAEQLDRLRKLRCTHVQGYYLCPSGQQGTGHPAGIGGTSRPASVT